MSYLDILNETRQNMATANPFENIMRGAQGFNQIQNQLLQNQQAQQTLDQNAALNPLLMQSRQAELQGLQTRNQAAQMEIDDFQKKERLGQLYRASQALKPFVEKGDLQGASTVAAKLTDFGLPEETAAEVQRLVQIGDADTIRGHINTIESLAAQDMGGQMSEYQRENLRLQEQRLRQKEEQSGSISPYQQIQLDIRQRKLDLDAQELDLKKKQREIDLADAEDKKRLAEEKEEMSKQQAMERAALVSSDLDRAMNLAGTMTTGFLGARTKGIEGTESYDLAQVLDGIKSNIGFAELNAMRQSSPTGAALGNVTERELELLQRTVGSLEQQQSKEQFLYNTKRTKVLFDSIVNGTNSVIFTQKQYDSLPSGSTYIDPDDGRVYRKP